MAKNKVISKGKECPKCKSVMNIKAHKGFSKIRVEKGGYYFSQWEYCRNCAYVFLEEKYKCLFKDVPAEMINQYEPVVNPPGTKKKRKEKERKLRWEKRQKKLKEKVKKEKKVSKVNKALFIPQSYKERYKEYMDSVYWARRKEEWYAKFTKTCWACHSVENIHLHHVSYERMGFERDDDLVSLCKTCHGELHDKYGTKNLDSNTVNFLIEKRESLGLPVNK